MGSLRGALGGLLLLAFVAGAACSKDATGPSNNNNNNNNTGSITLTLSATTLSIVQGAAGTVTATLGRAGNFTGAITIAIEGLPNNVTAVASPASAASGVTSSTITFTAAGGAAAGSSTITIRASGAGVTDRTVNLNLTITQASAGGNATFRVCDANPVLFAATQDGNGPWTVASVTDNTFTFNIASGRGGIVYVISPGAGLYQTVYFYGTQAELNNASVTCMVPSAGKTVNGSVANVGANELAWIGLGSPLTSVTPAVPNFTLQNVPDGVIDALATRVSQTINGSNVTQTANRAIIRRGLNPAAGSTLPVFDFNAAEAVTPVMRNLTVNNLGPDQLLVQLSFQTGAGTAVPLYSELPGTATAARQVPTLNGQAGDLHLLTVGTGSGGGPSFTTTRSLLAYFAASEDKTFTLGPDVGTVTVTNAATNPSLLLRTQYMLQPEYRHVTVNHNQVSGATTRSIIVSMTENYLAGSTTFDHTMADLSGLTGWQSVWALMQASVQWSLTGFTYTGTGAALDGVVTTLASRFGNT